MGEAREESFHFRENRYENAQKEQKNDQKSALLVTKKPKNEQKGTPLENRRHVSNGAGKKMTKKVLFST